MHGERNMLNERLAVVFFSIGLTVEAGFCLRAILRGERDWALVTSVVAGLSLAMIILAVIRLAKED